MAIAWIQRHPAKMQSIVGTTSATRIREIAEAIKIDLTREHWYEIYRGAGNRPQMDGAIVRNMRAGRESRAVCAGADTQQCIDALEGMTSFRWVKIEDGQCAEKCYLFKATEIASEISITR